MCKANGFFFMATHEICLVNAGIVQCSDSYNQALYRSFFGGIYVTGNQGIYHCIILYIIQQWDYSMISHDLFE